MGLARLSRPSSQETKFITFTISDDARETFDFLGLPKDIRLMVYEQLRMKTYRDKVLLRDVQHYLTLVTTVIPGISILATCRQVRAEASLILLPWLQNILSSPPTIVIRAEHIIGLVDLHDCYSSIYGTTFIEKLVSCLHDAKTVHRIIRHRQQGLPAKQLRKKLHLKELIAADDEASPNAFARFVLRAAKYIASNPDTRYRYPPLSLIVEVPDTFRGIPVTTSMSRMKSLSYKFFRPKIPMPPRRVTGLADLTWLLRRLTFHMSFSCELWRVVSLVVKLRYLEIGHTGLRIAGRSVQRAIIRGLDEAGCKGPCVVHYGGRVSQKSDEEI